MDFLKMAYNNYLKSNPEIKKELYKEAEGADYSWLLPAIGGLGIGGLGGYAAGKYLGQPAQPVQPVQQQLTPEEEAYLMQQNYAYPYGY